MPNIFDNINAKMYEALLGYLKTSYRADFSVGYFNLRGWRFLQEHIDTWAGTEDNCVRLLVGMHSTPREEIRRLYTLNNSPDFLDPQQIKRLKRRVVEDFRDQLMVGKPTNKDEYGLRALVRQLREGKLVVKLFLKYPLHAKLYLLHRHDIAAPIIGFLGSSNLTYSGLSGQGELNTDIVDSDAGKKLKRWFEERWEDEECFDITADLIEVIEESWAREVPLTPYEVYLKIAYHLAQEAIAGVSGEFKLPKVFDEKLFDYQKAAVQIAAHHLNKRGGVLLGDVVGLGKTLMATAVATIFEEQGSETLIICPKNLTTMWEEVAREYRLRGSTVVSLSMVDKKLADLARYRVVIIDESHNLRNAEGKRYAAIRDYVQRNESKVILLTATPYNKGYIDLAGQLSLFIDRENTDLGISPEVYIRTIGGEVKFNSEHQAKPRTLAAFEKSNEPDDWRELMRLYMVRRTRSFILNNYASVDPLTGRYYIAARDGKPRYFPKRTPKTVGYETNAQYDKLYSDKVVTIINGLSLPRYGLGGYVSKRADAIATKAEQEQIENLSHAGTRLMGFCRTNLFKRLESSGQAFLQSLDRHVLRNFVFLYAIENGLKFPIGTLDAAQLDLATVEDEDDNSLLSALEAEDDTEKDEAVWAVELDDDPTVTGYRQRARRAYELLSKKYKGRFKWLRSELFDDSLKEVLQRDCTALIEVLTFCGDWNATEDTKVIALRDLIVNRHRRDKVLVFSQFADTVRYLGDIFQSEGIAQLEAVTGQTDNPTEIAYRFSPRSNNKTEKIRPQDELRVLLTTDVLSEGQNLQDGAIVINYDLPWAIIRLSQRAGRVDRIGQQAEEILCYSFLPAEGVEQIIRLRQRVRERLRANGEVIGSDELFGVEEGGERKDPDQALRDLYTEKTTILDMEADTEVDLASYAYQIWLNATKDNPALQKKITDLPDVVYTTRRFTGSSGSPQGVVVYMKTAGGSDALAWLDERAEIVTQSQLAILRVVECEPDEPPISRHPDHHDLVGKAVDLINTEEIQLVGGQLGAKNSARRRTYERLKVYHDKMKKEQPVLVPQELERAIDDIYRSPLRDTARVLLNRQLRTGITDEELVKLVLSLRADDKLTLEEEAAESQEPRILCSLGLFDRE